MRGAQQRGPQLSASRLPRVSAGCRPPRQAMQLPHSVPPQGACSPAATPHGYGPRPPGHAGDLHLQAHGLLQRHCSLQAWFPEQAGVHCSPNSCGPVPAAHARCIARLRGQGSLSCCGLEQPERAAIGRLPAQAGCSPPATCIRESTPGSCPARMLLHTSARMSRPKPALSKVWKGSGTSLPCTSRPCC